MVTDRATIRKQDGRQVIELPESVQLAGTEVLVSQDVVSGKVTISTVETGNPWPGIFAEMDAIPVSEEDWEEFEYGLSSVRTVPVSRERVIFDEDDRD